MRRWLVWSILATQVLVVLATAHAQPGWPRQNPNSRQMPHDRVVSEVCPRHYISHETGVLDCPSAQGVILLPAHYPPRTLFVGYTSEPYYLAFLKALIERYKGRQSSLHIVVLIPRLEAEQAYHELKPFMQGPDSHRITFLTAPSDETLWTQDYMEVGISMADGQAKIIDLPYTDREGELIPASIALSCQLELLSQADFENHDEIPQGGDYGGNIEALPGNLVLIGNTMTRATRQRLGAILTEMALVEVKVDWLETGHVDELFTVLPNLTPTATCPFALAYVSPKLALQVVRENGVQPDQDRLVPEAAFPENISAELQDWEFFSECLSAYARSRQLSKRCQRFIDVNVHYDALIEQERKRIDTILVQRNTCASINWIALPQLFTPSFSVWLRGSAWGTGDDRAQALNPNTVNVIALGADLILPRQPYLPFEQEIAQRLTPLGLSLIRTHAAFSHFLNGGLHCNTSVVRTCRKKP